MSCYKPLEGYYSRFLNPSGKRSIVFNLREAFDDKMVKIRCGQCIGCRLRYSAQWATRCYHEAQMWPESCFVTLTYNDLFLPSDGSIQIEHCQKFMKRLRRAYEPKKIRMAYCGEYGEKLGRPHYHFILFNHDFADKYHWKTHRGFPYFRSNSLEKIWSDPKTGLPFGNALVCNFSFETAAYVARYITKKINGDAAFEHYNKINYETGEILNEYTKEFFKMSRRPGIGKEWFDKYYHDVYPHDFVVINGRKMQPPKFYDSQFEIVDPYTFDDIKEARVLRAKSKKIVLNNSPARLRVREKVQIEKFKQLKRSLEI